MLFGGITFHSFVYGPDNKLIHGFALLIGVGLDYGFLTFRDTDANIFNRFFEIFFIGFFSGICITCTGLRLL